MATNRSNLDSTEDYRPAVGSRSNSLTAAEVKRLEELEAEFSRRIGEGESKEEVERKLEVRLVQEGNPWADVWAHAAAHGHTRRDAMYRVMLDWINEWVENLKRDGQFGQFTNLQPLGSGSFGAVFRAYDIKRKGLVAIKLPHVPPERIPGDWDTVRTSAQQHANFFEEARKHANITVLGCVAIYESGMPDTFHIDQILLHLRTTPIWFSMQFIDGKSLYDVLHKTAGGYKRGETIPDDQVIDLMTKIAERLQSLHATPSPNGKGCIIHRDLKPANILLDQQSNPWLTDFGLASERFNQGVTGNPFSGTKAYAAPEQFAGIEANEQTDIWAWGVIFYELLTGQLPFDSPERICDQRSPVPKLGAARPNLPEYLESVIDKCLQRNRLARFGSFAAVLDELRIGTGGVTRRHGPAGDRLDPFGRIEDDLRDGFDRVETKVDRVHHTLSTDRLKQTETLSRLVESGTEVGNRVEEIGSKIDRIATTNDEVLKIGGFRSESDRYRALFCIVFAGAIGGVALIYLPQYFQNPINAANVPVSAWAHLILVATIVAMGATWVLSGLWELAQICSWFPRSVYKPPNGVVVAGSFALTGAVIAGMAIAAQNLRWFGAIYVLYLTWDLVWWRYRINIARELFDDPMLTRPVQTLPPAARQEMKEVYEGAIAAHRNYWIDRRLQHYARVLISLVVACISYGALLYVSDLRESILTLFYVLFTVQIMLSESVINLMWRRALDTDLRQRARMRDLILYKLRA